MRKLMLLAAGLVLIPLSALSQTRDSDRDRDRDADRDRDSYRRDVEEILRGTEGESFRGGGRRGAGFLLRSGDATIAVRCDPRDSMRSCVDATVTLLERARALMPPGGPGTSPGTPPRQ